MTFPVALRARSRPGSLLAVFVLAVFALAGLSGATGSARGADYPTRPIQLIVPYAAGGATDTVARLLQEGMQKELGQPLLVINRPGGNTIVGTQSVAHATPDGYTLVLVSVPHAANFTLYKEMPYAQSDFAPIGQVSNTPNVLVVNPSLPVNSLAEFIAYIKAHPGAINYGTFGVGSSAHLAALLFETKIGQKMTAVHYHGGAPAAVAVMSGEIQCEFGTPLSVAAGIDSGKLKPIAVTSKQRLTFLPNVPTMIESGLDYQMGAWFGLLAPAGTPQPVIARLGAAMKTAMSEPHVVKVLEQSGTDVVASSPEEFARFIADESRLWHGILAGMTIDKE